MHVSNRMAPADETTDCAGRYFGVSTGLQGGGIHTQVSGILGVGDGVRIRVGRIK